jgi:hypothetical protein
MFMLVWFFWILGLLALNGFLGALILAICDKDARILYWIEEAPSPLLKLLFLSFWPFILYFHYTSGPRPAPSLKKRKILK